MTGLFHWTSLVAQMVKRLPTMREIQVQSLGREDLLEKAMAAHSSTLAWKNPWTEEPDRLQFMGSQRVRQDWVTSLSLSAFIMEGWLSLHRPLHHSLHLGTAGPHGLRCVPLGEAAHGPTTPPLFPLPQRKTVMHCTTKLFWNSGKPTGFPFSWKKKQISNPPKNCQK